MMIRTRPRAAELDQGSNEALFPNDLSELGKHLIMFMKACHLYIGTSLVEVGVEPTSTKN